jgi:hypothetical protein
MAEKDQDDKINPRIKRLVNLFLRRVMRRMELEDIEKAIEGLTDQMTTQEINIARSVYRHKVLETFKGAMVRDLLGKGGREEGQKADELSERANRLLSHIQKEDV